MPTLAYALISTLVFRRLWQSSHRLRHHLDLFSKKTAIHLFIGAVFLYAFEVLIRHRLCRAVLLSMQWRLLAQLPALRWAMNSGRAAHASSWAAQTWLEEIHRYRDLESRSYERDREYYRMQRYTLETRRKGAHGDLSHEERRDD